MVAGGSVTGVSVAGASVTGGAVPRGAITVGARLTGTSVVVAVGWPARAGFGIVGDPRSETTARAATMIAIAPTSASVMTRRPPKRGGGRTSADSTGAPIAACAVIG